jgi:hypothetical protein
VNDLSKQSLAVLRQVAEFLEGLPADQVDDLAEGRARLTLIPWGASAPLLPVSRPARKPREAAPSTVDIDAVLSTVEAATSREDALTALNPLKVADLKAVAAAMRIGATAGTKAALVKQIVELTVGARLSGDALRAL